MKLIHDVIQENRKFVGRESELQEMERLLVAEDEAWSMLHFHGPSGMGKTVLLQQFEHMHADLPVIYVNGQQRFQTPEEFLDALYQQLIHKQLLTGTYSADEMTSAIGQITSLHPVFVILFDAIDQCADIQNWFKDEFVKSLPVQVRIFTTGTLPLDGWQNELGWESIVKNVPLQPFGKNEWTRYAAACGITDAHLQDQIGFISQGVPLAVSLTCGWILKQGNRSLLHESDVRYLQESFDRHLLAEENLNGVSKTLLALAALTYTFDQELLEHMLDLDQPISSAMFSRLCQSPFVEAHTHGGWTVKNGIRGWARAGLKRRYPDTYELYKQRAEEMLDRRMENTSENHHMVKMTYEMGKLFLHENDFVHSLVYRGDLQNFKQRTAHKEEIPKLAAMYQKNFLLSPPYQSDDSRQEQFLQDIYEAEPSSIQIIEHGRQCLCFYVFLPMNSSIRSILLRNPVTEKWVNATHLEHHDYFYWIISTYPPTDQEVIGYFVHHIFMPSLRGNRVTCLIWSEGQATSIQLLGFKPLTDFQYRTTGGMDFYFYTLDSRQTSIEPDIELESWIDLTKKLLTHYAELPFQLELLQQCKQYWKSNQDFDEIARRIHTIIDGQLQWLKEGSRQEKIQAQILQYAYLKKGGSHEMVAARLNLPTSTYYRQLKKLVHTLAYVLMSQTA